MLLFYQTLSLYFIKNPFFNQIDLTQGYETWISLGATVVETTSDFNEMDLGRRKCFRQNEDPFINDPNKYFQVREIFFSYTIGVI